MTAHSIKTIDAYFQAVKAGLKPFEVRRDDRGYQKGDVLLLRRYGKDSLHGELGYLSGGLGTLCGERDAETIHAEITYVLTGGQYGIEPGYVVLGIKIEDQS